MNNELNKSVRGSQGLSSKALNTVLTLLSSFNIPDKLDGRGNDSPCFTLKQSFSTSHDAMILLSAHQCSYLNVLTTFPCLECFLSSHYLQINP